MGKEVGGTETVDEQVTEEAVFNEAELVDAVQAKLDLLNGDTPDTDEEEQEEQEEKEEQEEQADDEESTPEKTGDDDDASQADDDDSTPEEKAEKAEKAAKDAAGDEEEVSLPDAYSRAAVHQGWTPEEVKKFFEADPELAIKTLAKIHESTNKLSADFASLGRASREPADKTTDHMTATEANAAATAGDSTELAAIKEEYGADSSVAKMFESMQEQLASSKTVASTQQNEAVTEQLDEATATLIDQFFSDPSMKSYEDFYGEGKDAAKLTQGQIDERWKVMDMADSIILGSKAQGRNVTVQEAMDMAHLSISEPVREQAVRNELKAKIVKRSMGLTLKPAKTKQVQPDKDAKLTQEQMESKVGAGLKSIFH